MSEKIIVYTALIGPGYTLYDPEVVDRNCHYVAFSDHPRQSSVWEVRSVAPQGDPRLQCRLFKAQPWDIFPDHEVSLWLDSKFQLACKPSEWLPEWLEAWDMVALRHPDRDNIEQEAQAIHRHGMVTQEVLQACIERYRADGWNPEKQRAITSTGICMRRHSRVVKAFGRLWWHEIQLRCIRDQMSVDYCAWLAGLKIGYIPGHYRDNQHARWMRK